MTKFPSKYYTKITFETQYKKVSIVVHRSDLTMQEVIDDLIKPALIGSGYSPELVNDYFEDE